MNWVPIDNTMIFRQNDIEMDTFFELGKERRNIDCIFCTNAFYYKANIQGFDVAPMI